uniref:Uncharacterized protein n=1 Tax=Nelumbo nucifera TaxID=4432 RepID=A0A822Z436_NELNU|nr:TPA_asm: hypothetical protein HUJ06_013733 [Nelumbo nucifera]
MMDIDEEIRSSIQSLQLDSAEDNNEVTAPQDVKLEEVEQPDKMEEDLKDEVQENMKPVKEPKDKEMTSPEEDVEESDEKEENKNQHLNVVFIGHVG